MALGGVISLHAPGGDTVAAGPALAAEAMLYDGVAPGAARTSTTPLRPAEYRRGHVFFTDDDIGDQLWIIVSGKVKIGQRAEHGRTYLFAIMGPMEVFGETSVLDPGPRGATATAVTEVCATPIGAEALRAWITERPDISEWLLRVLAGRLRRTHRDRCDLTVTDVPARVAKVLLDLGQQFGVPHDGALRLIHDLTQDELAQLVGARRVSVNKALGEFTRRGWIRRDAKTVVIVDAEALARRAR